jgi:hypothetical protein
MSTIAVIAPIFYDPITDVKLTSIQQHHAQIAVHNELVTSAEKMRKYIQIYNRFIIEENNYHHLKITSDNNQRQNSLNIIGHCEDFGIDGTATLNPIITSYMLSHIITRFLIENIHVTQVRLFICLAAPSFLNELVSEVIKRFIENNNDTIREIEFIAPQGLSYTHKRTEIVLHDVSETVELLGNSSTKEERQIIKRWKINDASAYMIINVRLNGKLISKSTAYSEIIR